MWLLNQVVCRYMCVCVLLLIQLFHRCRHAGVLKSRQCDMYVCVWTYHASSSLHCVHTFMMCVVKTWIRPTWQYTNGCRHWILAALLWKKPSFKTHRSNPGAFILKLIWDIILTLTSFLFLYPGRKNGDNDKNYDTIDLPKRCEPTKGRLCLSRKTSLC